MKLYKSVHTVYKTQYHIVWITRYRRKILVPGVKSHLEDQTPGNKKVLSQLGIYKNWNKARSYSSVYGNPPEIRGQYGKRDHQER